jgi:hypothetical protein
MELIIIKTNPEWQICIAEGDALDSKTTIATTNKGVDPTSHLMSVASMIGIKPEKIFKHLKVSIGQSIKKGDLIAEKSGLFSSRRCESQIDGVVTSIDHLSGQITIDADTSDEAVKSISAFINGKVKEISTDSISIAVSKMLRLQTSEPIIKRLGAPVVISDNTGVTGLEAPKIKGAAIVIPECSDYILAKLTALEASCVISNTNTTRRFVDGQLSLPYIEIAGDFESRYKKVVEFGPTHMYAEPSATDIIFYHNK